MFVHVPAKIDYSIVIAPLSNHLKRNQNERTIDLWKTDFVSPSLSFSNYVINLNVSDTDSRKIIYVYHSFKIFNSCIQSKVEFINYLTRKPSLDIQ